MPPFRTRPRPARRSLRHRNPRHPTRASRRSAEVEPRPRTRGVRRDAAEPAAVAHERAELLERAPESLVRRPGERTRRLHVAVRAELVPGVAEADPGRRPLRGVVPRALPLLDQPPTQLELHPGAVD